MQETVVTRSVVIPVVSNDIKATNTHVLAVL